jgi:hypothetical protein
VKRWEKYVRYSEVVAFVKEVKKEIEVNYNDRCIVACDKDDRLGFGHHDCTSCIIWEKYIIAFAALLKEKDVLMDKINRNKAFIKETLN